MKIGAPPIAERSNRVSLFAAGTAGLFAFSGALMWLAFAHITHAWYDPVGRTWTLTLTKPAPAAMDFYSKFAVATLAGALAAIAAGLAARRVAPPDRLLRALGVWSLAFTLLGISWYEYSLLTRKFPGPPAPAATTPPASTPK